MQQYYQLGCDWTDNSHMFLHQGTNVLFQQMLSEIDSPESYQQYRDNCPFYCKYIQKENWQVYYKCTMYI